MLKLGGRSGRVCGMKTMNEFKKMLMCHVDNAEKLIEAGKRAEFLVEAKEVLVVDSVPEGWEEIKLGKAEQLRFGLRKESGKWNWKGSIEPYKALATESGTTYNKCPGWENAPWGYDLVLPVGVWDKIKIDRKQSNVSKEHRLIAMRYSAEDMPEKVMLLERELG